MVRATLKAATQVTSSQQAIHPRTPAKFVRSAWNGCREMYALCPPVRSKYPHRREVVGG